MVYDQFNRFLPYQDKGRCLLVIRACGYFFIFLSLFSACTHTPPPVSAPIALETLRSPSSINDELIIFQKFVRNLLSPEELANLIQSCHSSEQVNSFCPIYLNYEKIESLKKEKLAKTTNPRPKETITVELKKDKIDNFESLTQKNVTNLISYLEKLPDERLEPIKIATLNYAYCPNNLAAALASRLENKLPNDTDYALLAQLYEKGSLCYVDRESDRENLITRAGLFYLLAKNTVQAEILFKKASSIEGPYTGRSLYWLYKTYLQNKKAALGQLTYELLKRKYPFSFHTLVATTEKSDESINLATARVLAPKKESSRNPFLNQLIRQFEVLKENDYQPEAKKVLEWMVLSAEEAEPESQFYVANLSGKEGDYLSKISVLSKILYENPELVNEETLQAYFPKVHFDTFEKNNGGMDPFFLLAVARQESAFNKNAVSPAKAKGLLQLLNKTAQRYLKGKNINLYDPETNVIAGSRYITDLLKRSNQQTYLALASYNAGENKVDEWVQRYPTKDPILFIDLIPYRETREYVASILRNYYWYRKLYGPKPLRELKQVTVINP